MKKTKIIKLFTLGIIAVISLTACGKDTAEVNKSSVSNPKTVIVGTGNAFKPYCYLGADGKPTGYEVAVLQEVDKRLPQYKFEYQAMDFSNILISLQSGKIDIAAHQYAKNAEREKNYLFGTQGYANDIVKLTVLKTRNDIKSIKDLNNKNVQVSTGSNAANYLENYNKEHGTKINLIYGSPDTATLIKSMEDGKIDAFFSWAQQVDMYNKSFGDVLKLEGEPIYNTDVYQVYRKNESKLKTDVDNALKDMKKDGTLSKISIKYLGADYTK
ncbi:L-cystine transport system substrate-binding protein [Clostridium acidisoli DSM 12555]|uniref:L-cystine transport system substrate-binding protein n=1 Tax=Clostridium acidisoli DSM 12555 TaxID=1121291 RepID=A0A1W1XUR1_9CLOT|nr:transporter substrate-binding domain-containing protein [Clostridium acidisoli]SMC27637.1 L-cystine transport system substrate-binding protein [Clostridium acidisoli DSM 12555]